MEPYIETTEMKLIFKTGHSQYPYLLEVTEFVKNSDNPNNYSGEREFRLLNKDFIATGDGFSLSRLAKYYPECELFKKLGA